jgi:hypothetical protein
MFKWAFKTTVGPKGEKRTPAARRNLQIDSIVLPKEMQECSSNRDNEIKGTLVVLNASDSQHRDECQTEQS